MEFCGYSQTFIVLSVASAQETLLVYGHGLTTGQHARKHVITGIETERDYL